MIKGRATQQGNSIAVTLETKFAQLENEEKEDTETQSNFNAPSTIEGDSSWSVVSRQRNRQEKQQERREKKIRCSRETMTKMNMNAWTFRSF